MRIYGGGSIKVRNMAEIPAEVHAKGTEAFGSYSDSPDGGLWGYGDGIIDSMVEDFLEAVKPYAESGLLYFDDGEGCRWRYALRNGEWVEEGARVQYFNTETGEWEEE